MCSSCARSDFGLQLRIIFLMINLLIIFLDKLFCCPRSEVFQVHVSSNLKIQNPEMFISDPL